MARIKPASFFIDDNGNETGLVGSNGPLNQNPVWLAGHASEHAALGNVPTVTVDPLTGGVNKLVGPNGRITLFDRLQVESSGAVMPISSDGVSVGANANGYITNLQMPALAAFYGVRLKYLNYDTSGTMTIDGAKVSPVAVHNVKGNNDAGMVWSPAVTFAGSTTGTVPQATTGTDSKVIPGVLVSDFTPCTCKARTDTPGAPYLLRVATHVLANSVEPGMGSSDYVAMQTSADNPNLKHGTYTFTNTLENLVATSATTLDNAGGYLHPIEVIFYYSTSVPSLPCFGDSRVCGWDTTGVVAGWPQYVTWSSYSAGTPISTSNYALSSEVSTTSLAKFKAHIATYKPDFASIQAWSYNDGDTQANYDAAWANCLEFISACRIAGIIPVVLNAAPAAGRTWSRISALNTRVASLPVWVRVVDVASVTNDPANPGNLLASVDSGDHVHWNDVGHKAVAALVIAAVNT